ncbi:MAG: succinate--hydroxymethylglutarate CoA-transferase-like [Burkholderiales bacterium]|jgi:crotonobetainyl-CoA:carnitine CoA-transferase CaiB-like acyl-CoA transferase|nr:succinate--hydroxymethylglutarate CoA-transferase-like [Burkholderiales bacterium]
MSGPLEGITVVDLTTIVAGPTATQVLADYGADIIKVESPDGDLMRAAGPSRSPGMGHIFINTNRNKRSIVLDLKKPEGRGVVLDLIGRADVLAYNIRPQAMDRLGLGYSQVLERNPRIVYAGAIGFSQRGPYAGRPAYDDLIQGMSGIPWLTRRAGAEVPRYAPTVLADRIVGLHLALAVLAALQYRARTGKGQRVDVPMYEIMVSTILGEHLAGRLFEPSIGEAGYSRSLAVDRRPYRTRDGYVCVVVYNDNHWRNFLAAIGQSDLFERDKRFSSQEMRLRHIDEVTGFLKEVMATRDTAEWLRVLQEADVPAGPMNDIDDILIDPHLAATGFFRRVRHPTEGMLVDMAIPTEWSESPPDLRHLAATLGEHTEEVLLDAGYSADQIAALAACGAIGAIPPRRVKSEAEHG